MSEYVFRTNKPIEYCYECPLHNSENGSCNLGVATYGLDVPKRCPLKELPPHGRLGDLDAIRETVEYSAFWDDSDHNLARDIIKDAPTILEASET